MGNTSVGEPVDLTYDELIAALRELVDVVVRVELSVGPPDAWTALEVAGKLREVLVFPDRRQMPDDLARDQHVPAGEHAVVNVGRGGSLMIIREGCQAPTRTGRRINYACDDASVLVRPDEATKFPERNLDARLG